YKQGALVGAPFTLATLWTTAMLPYLKLAQVGNTVTICYGGQGAGVAAIPPQDLVKTSGSDTAWALAATLLAAPSAAALNWVLNISDGTRNYGAGTTYNIGDRALA